MMSQDPNSRQYHSIKLNKGQSLETIDLKLQLRIGRLLSWKKILFNSEQLSFRLMPLPFSAAFSIHLMRRCCNMCHCNSY